MKPEQEIALLRNDNASLREQLAAERSRSQLQVDAIQQHRIDALEAQVARQQLTIHKLEAELRQMRRSITWRGTEPVRQVYARVQRLRRPGRSMHRQAALDISQEDAQLPVLAAAAWNQERFMAVPALAATPVTDIIMCVGKDSALAVRCIESIRRHTAPGTYRLLLVTHQRDAARLAEQAPAEATIITHAMEQFNFARANNLALNHCPGDVVLLNDDTEVTAGWLDDLRADARGFALTTARTGYERSGNPDTWDRGSAGITYYPVTMFCAFIPWRVRQVVGMLDEEYAYYGGEDIDYSCRVLLNGFPLVVSSAFVHHAGAQSFGPDKVPLMHEAFRVVAERYSLRPPFDLTHIQPLVSIVVTARDQAGSLAGAAQALLAGSYPEIELVVVDDASSTDETDAAVRTLQKVDSRVIGIRLPMPAGSAVAQGRGVIASQGQFIAFSNPGDISRADHVLALLGHLMVHPELSVVYGAFESVSDKGRRRGHTAPFDLDRYRDGEIDIAVGALLARRQVLADVPFAAQFERAAIYDWVFRVVRRGYQIGYCPVVVAELNESGANSPQHYADLRSREQLVDRLSKR